MIQPDLFYAPPKLPTRMEAEKRKRRVTEKLLDSWQSAASPLLENDYARTHEYFLAEDFLEWCGPLLAPPPDKRSLGAVMIRAKNKGVIIADGTAKARTSNNSYKTRWRSRRYQSRGIE